MSETEIEISERQHADIIRQMKIDTILTGVMAASSLVTMIVIFLKLNKHITTTP